MMLRAYLFGIAAALFVLIVVVSLLRQRKLRERHAVWWLGAGVLALIAGAFPQSLTHVANFLGIELPVNLVFFVSITILFLVSLQHAAELTRLEAKTRDLAETVALLELRVRELGGESLDRNGDQGATPDGGSDNER